ncbi:Gfo/Idh/MocA family oxidoreductase [bacterium]|nr:Gfo/Idh/MocA family oxidoreductase [bacterium]
MKIKAAIVGSGFAADIHADGYEKCSLRSPTASPYGIDAEIVAVTSPTETHVKSFADRFGITDYYTDYNEMLKRDDIDIVSVCVPNYLHHDVSVAVASAGKNIVCEKPLAVTLEEADNMIRVAEQHGVKLFYAENWLFAPAMVRVAEIVKSGAIGDVLYFKAKEAHGGSHSQYALKKKYCGGGCLIHMAIHPIGYGLALKEGVKPARVYAETSGGGENNILHPHCEGEDFSVLIIDFEDGTRGLIDANYITKGGLDDIVEIYGSKGTIKADFSKGSPIKVFSLEGYDYAVEKAEMTTGWTFPTPDEKWSLGYPNEIAHFVECLIENKEPIFGSDGKGGRDALQIVMAGYESAQMGKAVML